MAKVDWSAGIDSVSGALAKPSKKGQHSCFKMLLGTHRVAETTSDSCNRIYMRKKTKRRTPLSNDERAQRGRFGIVAAAVAARAKDLSKVTADQQNFLAQKDLANGKPTMKSYLWSLELAAYDEEHS